MACDAHAALATAIAFFPEDRWSAPTLAAALTLVMSDVASLTPMVWAQLLDRIEAALSDVIASVPEMNNVVRFTATH